MDKEDLRIPFDIAISEPRLLKTRFSELSLPQQVTLKTIYGLHLSPEVKDERGWSETDYYSAFQGGGVFDDLGFLKRIDHQICYKPQEFGEAWLCEGVRSGKSTIASFIAVYEGVCGGHEAFVRPGRRLYIFQIAQDLRQAKYALHDILANLESVPFLMGPKKRIQNVTAERIDLWNSVTIATTPPTVKSVRGYDSPVGVLDEVAVWYQEADSANPDFAIYQQVKSRQAQFWKPKIVGISSPWNKGGLLWNRVKAGTNGTHERCEDHIGASGEGCSACSALQKTHRSRLVMVMPTAAMFNPNVSGEWLEGYRDSDRRGFERECLAKFLDSISGFLDADLIHASVARGVRERAPISGNVYVAAMDPAFKRDSFAFSIGHMGPKQKMVFDVIKRWTRHDGEAPLDPRLILWEIQQICRRYKVGTIFTDQHEITSLKTLALEFDLTVVEFSLQAGSKNDAFANLASLLNQRRLSLLDHEDTTNELLSLERKLTQGGGIQIAAPPGQNDDLALVVALVANQAVWLSPVGGESDGEDPAAAEDEVKPIQDQIKDQIAQKWHIQGEWGGVWD